MAKLKYSQGCSVYCIVFLIVMFTAVIVGEHSVIYSWMVEIDAILLFALIPFMIIWGYIVSTHNKKEELKQIYPEGAPSSSYGTAPTQPVEGKPYTVSEETPAEINRQLVICPYCGAKNPPGTEKCVECGTEL